MGKKQVGELEPMELVVTILISELVSIPMQDLSVPLMAGIVPVVTIMMISALMSFVLLKSTKMRRIVVGTPSILVHEGIIDKKEMRKNNINNNELLEALRLKNVTDVAAVQYAILETNGQMSIIQHPKDKPPTASELSGDVNDGGLPVMVVNDGKWQDNNIRALGLGRGWIEEQARLLGVTDVKNIFLMTVDEQRKIFLQPN